MLDFDDAGEDTRCCTLQSGQVQVCGCGVIVLVFWFGKDAVVIDPTFHQQRWIRRRDPELVRGMGFGWEFGKPHACIPAGCRPVDALERERGRAVAGAMLRRGPIGTITIAGREYALFADLGDDGEEPKEESNGSENEG